MIPKAIGGTNDLTVNVCSEWNQFFSHSFETQIHRSPLMNEIRACVIGPTDQTQRAINGGMLYDELGLHCHRELVRKAGRVWEWQLTRRKGLHRSKKLWLNFLTRSNERIGFVFEFPFEFPSAYFGDDSVKARKVLSKEAGPFVEKINNYYERAIKTPEEYPLFNKFLLENDVDLDASPSSIGLENVQNRIGPEHVAEFPIGRDTLGVSWQKYILKIAITYAEYLGLDAPDDAMDTLVNMLATDRIPASLEAELRSYPSVAASLEQHGVILSSTDHGTTLFRLSNTTPWEPNAVISSVDGIPAMINDRLKDAFGRKAERERLLGSVVRLGIAPELKNPVWMFDRQLRQHRLHAVPSAGGVSVEVRLFGGIVFGEVLIEGANDPEDIGYALELESGWKPTDTLPEGSRIEITAQRDNSR